MLYKSSCLNNVHGSFFKTALMPTNLMTLSGSSDLTHWTYNSFSTKNLKMNCQKKIVFTKKQANLKSQTVWHRPPSRKEHVHEHLQHTAAFSTKVLFDVLHVVEVDVRVSIQTRAWIVACIYMYSYSERYLSVRVLSC